MEKEEAKRLHKETSLLKVSSEEAERLHSSGGYDMTVNDIKILFDASDSWVRKNWVPFVSHINYPCDHAKLWFCKDAFWRRYEENAVASVRKHPDIRPGTSAEERDKILARASVQRAQMPWLRVELPRDKDGNYNVGMSIKEFQVQFEEDSKKTDARDCGRSREFILRRLYCLGATKIEIFGKVFWVDPFMTGYCAGQQSTLR